MKRSCPYCGRVHDYSYVCPKKPKKKSGAHRSKAGDLRKTNKWKQKSIQIRARDKYLCQWCLTMNKITTDNLSVHHIVPINDNEDLLLDNYNLVTLCHDCHDRADRGLIPVDELKKIAKANENFQ